MLRTEAVQAPAATASNAGRSEAQDWARLATARDDAEFDPAWLALLCAQLPAVRAALLVRGSHQRGGFSAAAVWPEAAQADRSLAPVAERALASGRGDLRGAVSGSLPALDGEPVHLAYPVAVDGVLHGAVALELQPVSPQELQRAPRVVHWACAQLEARLRAQAMSAMREDFSRVSQAGELLATALQHARLGAAALALANELSARLSAQRVSVGLVRARSVEVVAMSHTALVEASTDGVRLIVDAMEEVLDAGLPLSHPAAPELDGADAVPLPDAPAQAALAAANGNAGVLSVPLVDAAGVVGLLTLERATAAFSEAETHGLRALGQLLGPVLALQRDNERGLWRRAVDGTGDTWRRLTGPGHAGLKLGTLGVLLLLAVPLLVDVPHRVAARTVIEGEMQRASVAPFAGVVAEAPVRAGDTVRAGALLARMQDRDLQLEQARWLAEEDLADRRYRQAAALRDRAEMAQAQARIAQARAQRQLADEQLARARVLAPFDGVVVSGDGRSLQGLPLEQGKPMFEIAPLNRWRVVLEVDERDIAAVRPGQRGELALAGLTGERVPFAVRQVTPVSTARDGRNFYRVEADVAQAAADGARLRPGMEGVGKIEAGHATLAWIWTHGLTDWLRLALWKWLP